MRSSLDFVSRTAVVIEVPEAESIAGAWRRDLTADGALGMPPHVTILFPFIPLDEFVADDLARLRAVAARHRIFDFALSRTAWFGDDVLWLAPEPAPGFHHIIEDVATTFPALRPYGGAHDVTVPHLTLGASDDTAALKAAAIKVEALLPVHAKARALAIFAETADGRWARRHVIPLGVPER